MASKQLNNVSSIVELELCSGCGACTNVCNIIDIKKTQTYNYPVIGPNCRNCKQCLNVCPGLKYVERNQLYDDNVQTSYHSKLYVGASTDEYIRINSSSGGIVTTLLIYLLENNIIDGAICIRQSFKDPADNEVIIASSKSEVIECMGSRYSPVSVCEKLNKYLDNKKRYAVVGKPCEIEGIKNLVDRKILNNIVIKISLMCAGTPEKRATDKLLSFFGEKETSIKSISYRGNGWPGEMRVINKNNEEKKISYIDGWNNILSKSCTNKRCIFCDDPFGMFSDITVGDAWSEEFLEMAEKGGYSSIITNTSFGDSLISQLSSEKKIEVSKIKFEDLSKLQKFIFQKKQNLFDRLYFIASKNFIADKKLVYEASNHNLVKFVKFYIKLLIK